MTRRVHDHAITDTTLINALANLDDDSGAFMPQHFRWGRWKQALGDVDVGTANADGIDFHHYPAGFAHGVSNLVKRKFIATVPSHQLHHQVNLKSLAIRRIIPARKSLWEGIYDLAISLRHMTNSRFGYDRAGGSFCAFLR
jgi:hypothetical protein